MAVFRASCVGRHITNYATEPILCCTRHKMGLTARETEILNLLVKGHAYKGIAHELSISINTVNMFIKSIYKKMHVHSRGEAAAKVQKR